MAGSHSTLEPSGPRTTAEPLSALPTAEEAPPLPAARDRATTKDMAASGTLAETDMGLVESIRTYSAAIAWSVLLSAAIIMEGFDHVLTGQFYALPQFKRKFGVQQPDGSFEVPAAWQAGLSNGVLLGSLIGISIAGWAAERFGYRRTMMAERRCLHLLLRAEHPDARGGRRLDGHSIRRIRDAGKNSSRSPPDLSHWTDGRQYRRLVTPPR